MDKETPKRTEQQKTVQKTAQKETAQSTAVQKNTAQKKEVQKEKAQNTAVQKKTAQSTAVQKNTTQKKTAQKTSAQKKPAAGKKTAKTSGGRKVSSAKKRKKARRIQISIRLGLVLLAAAFVALAVIKLVKPSLLTKNYFEVENEEIDASEPEIDVELLTVNPYSRPGTKTGKIKGIVMHYTANPGATAIANRNYFEGLKDSHVTKSSSNFIVGLEGEIIQCVPTWEIAYASNERNIDTVSIECCHPDESGEFLEDTYQSMVRLCAWLCLKFDLSEKDIIRHYDVTEKICPKYFVEDEKAWENFRKDVKKAIKKAG